MAKQTPDGAPVMTPDSGILLTLLKERVPNWFKLTTEAIRAKLTELAEALFGDASAVPGLMDTVERMKAKEARDAELAARLERYSAALKEANMAAAHFILGEKERVKLTARHTEDLARVERNRSGNASIIYRFLQAFPETDLLPSWPRLAEQYHPERLVATAEAQVAGTAEDLRLKRHQAELADALRLREEMTAWGKAGRPDNARPRAN